ncbi:MAG: S8 family serine peptidase [Pseudomonadales bacterium]|nr:S8 family serine peptidase [Pseudomonadales bacterium]
MPRSLALILLICLVSACGGGGGSGASATPAPPPAPVNNAPTARFTATPTSGLTPLRITADASTSTDGDGSITAYAWDFGDGDSAIGSITSHTYTTTGSFTLRLTVTDDDGATGTATTTISVNDSAATFTLSGAIKVLPSSAIDSDTNDRFSIAQDNNGFDQAQHIPNPVTAGGFANMPGTGDSTGNLRTSGDPGDFYQATFTGSETILLTIANPQADLDLRLWDANRNLVDSSVGVTQTESIAVTAPGDYFIEVFPVSGASNYVLNVGQNLGVSSLAINALRLSSDFVPGELIVQARRPGFARQQLKRTSRRDLREREPGLYRFAEPQQRIAAMGRMPGALPAGGRVSESQKLKLATLTEIKGLRRSGEVVNAEPNGIRRPLLEPNDQYYGLQWHYRAINLPLAWDVTTGSSDVVVAVVDTGVLLSHPDLDAQLVAGYDFISSSTRARDGDGIDANPNDDGDLAYGGSSSFHGTHVAGTVAAESNNSVGVAGVAWNARIMPLRALGKDGGTAYDVMQAIRYAAGLSNDSGTVPARPADIINLSLGSAFSSQAEQDTINEARSNGVIIIAAAGNEASTAPSYPASYAGVVSVSATTITNSLAGYSNRGPGIDIAAPGGNSATDINGDGVGDGVVSTLGDDGSGGPVQFGYYTLNGTSMAAPHVAGVAALMKAIHPGLTPAQFDAALASGVLTDDLGAAGRDDSFGYGLINAQKAIAEATRMAAGQGVDPGPILSASLATLNFGPFGTQLPLTLMNIGTGAISVTGISASQTWLTVTASDTGDEGLGDYTITVDRTGLADGIHTATINVASTANPLVINVLMQVSSVDLTANAGLHFVILVDSDDNSILPAEIATFADGEYTFTISDVPSGQYRLFAGTDSDNDDFLCDPGEACGAYSTLDSPETLQVNADRTGLTFLSGFRTTLGTFSATAGKPRQSSGFAISKPATESRQ